MSYKPREFDDAIYIDDDGNGTLKVELDQPDVWRTPEEIDDLIQYLKSAADDATCQREGAHAEGDVIYVGERQYKVTRRGVSRYGLIDKPPHISYSAGYCIENGAKRSGRYHIIHKEVTRVEKAQ